MLKHNKFLIQFAFTITGMGARLSMEIIIIGANYYPELGEYSCADSLVIKKHMQQMASAGFSIVAVTWLGKDDYTYKSLSLIFKYAAQSNLKICFQIEPCVRKTALSTVNEMQFISK